MGRVVAEATIEIAAPIDQVWAVMTDLPSYGAWNPFIVRVDGGTAAPKVGDRFALHVAWDGGGATSGEEVTRVDAPRDGRACFAYAFRGALHAVGAVRALREQHLESLADGRTRYATTEVF